MIQIKTKLRKWGNSLGIVVPQIVIEKENTKEGDEVIILFKKENDNILEEMFGTFKFKKSVKELMKEVDEELYND